MRRPPWVTGEGDRWLSYRAISGGVSSEGLVQLLESEGESVISDIDDTIKITEIPAGTEVVLRNTFLRDFAEVPEMAQIYRALLPKKAFHYVSGGPWQLYGPLAEFLISKVGFPIGSFHLRAVDNPLSGVSFLNDLRALVENGFSVNDISKEATRQHKLKTIK